MGEAGGTGGTARTAGPRTGDGHASRSPDGRRETLERLRVVAAQLETAAVLDRRASRSASPALAHLLRERAARRRRSAERVRAAALAEEDVTRRCCGPVA
jgi:hypothetical protein